MTCSPQCHRAPAAPLQSSGNYNWLTGHGHLSKLQWFSSCCSSSQFILQQWGEHLQPSLLPCYRLLRKCQVKALAEITEVSADEFCLVFIYLSSYWCAADTKLTHSHWTMWLCSRPDDSIIFPWAESLPQDAAQDLSADILVGLQALLLHPLYFYSPLIFTGSSIWKNKQKNSPQ